MVSTAWSSPSRSTASATRSGSEWSTSSGRRVSTRQKPHARVQRSPSTMNVAVPSAQHSDRFGQPASSQTVTRSSSRTARLSARTSGPWWTFGRSQSGLRVEICSPPMTPAWASRSLRCCDASRTTAPGPAPRQKAERSSGRCRQATSWRSTVPPPQASAAARRDRVDHLLHRDVEPFRLQRRHRPCRRCRTARCGRTSPRSVETLRAKPCIVRPRLRRTPIAAILRGWLALGVDPDAGVLAQPAAAGQAEVGQRVDQHLLDRPHVGDGVGQPAEPVPRLGGSVRIG